MKLNGYREKVMAEAECASVANTNADLPPTSPLPGTPMKCCASEVLRHACVRVVGLVTKGE